MKRGEDGLDMEIHQFVSDVRQRSAHLCANRRMSWPERRRIAMQARYPWYQGGPEMDRIEQVMLCVHPVAFGVRLYWPSRVKMRPSPVMVYLHGGGWCMLGVDTHQRLIREYAHAAEIPVLAVDYSLAPEFPYPVALEQTVAALEWLLQEGLHRGINAHRVLLAGDSAGANLALGSALRLRAAGRLQSVKALLLNYGVWTPYLSRQARKTLGAADAMLAAAEMDGFWREYLGQNPENRIDAFCAPLGADLCGLPPACLLWGNRDLLAEQNMHMVERLRQSGIYVQSKVYPGAPHSFIEAMAVSRQARDAIACGAAWARRYLFESDHRGVHT